jgi:chromosome segregation ATPase
MTIADMKRDLEAKIDAIDENKNVKKKYDNLNTRYEEMEKKKDELQNQVDIFRQKEAEKEAALIV